MATESVAGNDTLSSLPEPDINDENLKEEKGETSESSSEARIQDDASVLNIESNYQPEVILNSIFTSAIANIPPVTRLARPRVSEDQFFMRHRGQYPRNRWQELKKRVKRTASKIRNSKYCLYVLILLIGLPLSAIIFSLTHVMKCRKSTTIHVFLSGILGFLLIICRLFTITIRHFLTNLRGKEPVAVTRAVFVGLIAIFLTGMIIFYNEPPVFDPASDEYCDKDFYTYIHGMNIVVSCILFIAVLLHAPKYI